jgi:hypothetical protein
MSALVPVPPRPASSRGRLTEHPGPSREPIDRDARPRLYARAFDEHERAVAFARSVAAEHHERFGMRTGCRHVTCRND